MGRVLVVRWTNGYCRVYGVGISSLSTQFKGAGRDLNSSPPIASPVNKRARDLPLFRDLIST
jgi:hypothetical protein